MYTTITSTTTGKARWTPIPGPGARSRPDQVPGASSAPRFLRPRLRTALCLTALLLVAAAPAAGNNLDPFRDLDRDRLQMELERTDQVIQRTREVLRDCASAKGKALLEDAIQLQERAWEAFRSMGPDLDPAAAELARRLTIQARTRAVDAIETCQVEFRALESLREMMDSSHELIVDVRPLILGSGDAEARRLLDAGVWQLEKAHEAYRAREYRKALSLAGAARTLVQRAVQRAQRPDVSARWIEDTLSRTDQLLDEIAATVAGKDEKATSLLEQARREQDEARGHLRDGRPELALRRTRLARTRALDALWLVESTPAEAQIQRALTMVDRLLREAEPIVRQAGDPQAEQLLDAAKERLDFGRDRLERGETRAAAQAARTADSLLRRALERIEGS